MATDSHRLIIYHGDLPSSALSHYGLAPGTDWKSIQPAKYRSGNLQWRSLEDY